MFTAFATLLGACLLFAVGLRLSAFFSGAETGFYRLSPLRLSIDADGGDPIAQRLAWFARRPSWFVATTLVGNNVANYATTLAIGMATIVFVGSGGGWIEIVATLAVAPVVFVLGELTPKSLFYRAPMSLLRRATPLFGWFYVLFLPISLPLVALARLFERLSGTDDELDLLGRNRLVQALSQGRRHGLLTDVQNRLAHGVLAAGNHTVREAMTPIDRVLGVARDAERESLLEYAGRFGLTHVCLHDASGAWVESVRTVDVALDTRSPAALASPLVTLEAGCSRLEALIQLLESSAARGIVVEGGTPVGVVSRQGLVEQLFQSPGAWSGDPSA